MNKYLNILQNKYAISFITFMSISVVIYAAAVHDPATKPWSTIASFAVSTTNLETVATGSTAKVYQPWFENGAWTGDLLEYNLSPAAVITTTSNWSAQTQLDNLALTSRKIITTNGVGVTPSQKAFVWSALSTTQKTSLDSVAQTAGDTTSKILDFIRGDRTNEADQTGGTLRQRYSILGDIIHADPVYVAAPSATTIYDAGYDTFKTSNSSRAARVYAGANDGMLHVFDAATGNEEYAYIPSMLINKLNLLSVPSYTHQYYVDGGLAAGDMDIDTAIVDWRTVLVGSLGAGGKGLFALDITSPTLTSESGTDNKILWEISGSDADIGHIYDKAEFGKLSDNNWYAIIGNGYGSTNDVAKLLLIDSSGSVTSVGTGLSTVGNGLSSATLVDVDLDGIVDYAYAGDLLGNVYRFNVKDLTNITVHTLFSAGANKPITAAPKVSEHPAVGGRIVLFATGSLLSATDVSDTSTQTIYGIRDYDTATTISNSNLIIQTLSADVAIASPAVGRTDTVRTITTPVALNWNTSDGWEVDLPAGERVTLDPNIRAKRFQVMSINPVTQEGWLIQLDILNGASSNIFYDLDGDNVLDADDTVNRTLDVSGNPTGIGDIPVAIKQGVGSFSRQLITRVTTGIDANFINGLLLAPVPQPCVVDCTGGFAKGHIDVDTDTPRGSQLAPDLIDQYCYQKGDRAAGIAVDANGVAVTSTSTTKYSRIVASQTIDGYAGGTDDGHQHEYDKAHGTVEVDYFNLEAYCLQDSPTLTKTNSSIKLSRVTEAGIGNSTQFFVIVANADLSPGSHINIGEQSWTVVEYQRLIQEKLDSWNKVPADFSAHMVVDGNSLLHTLNDIRASITNGTGKLSNSFNDNAIIEGGLHPTQSGCVRDQLTITNNRWRNGALITQLIAVDAYTADPTTVMKQTPTDLPTTLTFQGVTTTLIDTVSYGGMLANNYGSLAGVGTDPNGANYNKAFLYESTLFWHFGKLYDLQTGNGKPCYGDADYTTARTAELAGVTLEEFELLRADTTNKLGSAYQDLLDAIAAGDQATIDQAQADYDKIYNKLKDYIRDPGTVTTSSTSTTIVGAPVTHTGTSITDTYILGPNSVLGRRNWTDFKP